MNNTEFHELVGAMLQKHGAIDTTRLTNDSDLYDSGLSSFASVQLMLALEEHLGIEFPERMLNRRTFSTMGNIVASLQEITCQKVA